MASPLGLCFDGVQPSLSAGMIEGQLRLGWQPIPGAESYRISQFNGACVQSAPVQLSTSASSWVSPLETAAQGMCYQVEALSAACVALPSAGRTINPAVWHSLVGWRLDPNAVPLY